MKYLSTRGGGKVSASTAIVRGIAPDGGLYVPENFPVISLDFEDPKFSDYRTTAFEVLLPFLSELGEAELQSYIDAAYEGENFSSEEIVPLSKVGDLYFLELYHGRTAAFKDMALSILPYLMTASTLKEGENDRIAILTATSGDTGIAALKGFEDVPGTEIVVFFPEEGVSAVQKLQMRTASGSNTHVFGIEGNFDEAQRGVKAMLADRELAGELKKRGYKLSAANSINIGRLLPQIVYYVWAYSKLVRQKILKNGSPMNVSVPSGNFGNILSAYYAFRMGLPIGKFVCASNKNNVLSEFFSTGMYDARRELYLTNSPSMDIIISSNLERLLYHLSEGDTEFVRFLMQGLEEEGVYDTKGRLGKDIEKFYSGWAAEREILDSIGSFYEQSGYLMDTHTAAGYKVAKDYMTGLSGDDIEVPMVITSTASPYKFSEAVLSAIGISACGDALDGIESLNVATGIAIPSGLAFLKDAPIRHSKVIDISEMRAALKDALA